MNVMEIVQSILTYFCTAGFVSAVFLSLIKKSNNSGRT